MVLADLGADVVKVEHPGGDETQKYAERVRRRDEVVTLLAEAFARRPVGTWIRELRGAGVPAEPVRSMGEAFASPEGRAVVHEVVDAARGPLRLVANPIRIDGDRGRPPTPPPVLGNDTAEILGELDGG